MKPKLIVNTNRIIAALIRDSVSRKLMYHADLEFLGINFSMKEIEKHRSYIIEKAKIDAETFEKLLEQITRRVTFIMDELIYLHIEEANKIMFTIDPDDVPFIAAALATGADIWSDDPHFMKQRKIRIWKTADLTKWL